LTLTKKLRLTGFLEEGRKKERKGRREGGREGYTDTEAGW
jgi:hypothetical protein